MVLRTAAHMVRRADARIRSWTGRRRALVYVRTSMHAAVLEPIARALEQDPRVDVWYLSERADKREEIANAVGRRLHWISSRRAAWARVDLLLTSDPWTAPRMNRSSRRVNFFHGVAGKYDLDDPSHLPIGFEDYDRVAFVNADRMRRYLDKGIIRREAAVLVGFPKIDALVNGRYDGAAIRERLGLEMHRPTAIYAPTWSPASSLHVAGDAIVASLVDSGWNVIIKPHARSFDLDPQYGGGINWRQRLRKLEVPGRVVFSEAADASPLLAASNLMVTDHSSVGFEFCLLDRPLIVFDAPDLPRVARINPERLAALRSAARIVSNAIDVGRVATEELANPRRLSGERARVALPLFYEPGTATDRALLVAYELLELRPNRILDATVPHAHAVGASI